MSKLDELISVLCPDGVPYKYLSECCSLEKGKTPIQKAIPGEYPLVVTTAERKTSNDYQFDGAAVCIPLVSSRGHGVACLNAVYYQEGKFALGNILCGVTPHDNSGLSAKFLYYYLNLKKDTLIVPLMKEDGRDGYEYYLFAQTDSRPHWSEIRICYHQTVLAELGGVILDGGRYFTATPDRDGISLTEYHNWDVPYRYMVKGNLNHLVHEFYYVDDGDEARHSHNEYEGCILIFEDEKEHQRFKIYVRKNWDRKDEFVNDIWIPHMEQLPGYNMDAFREEYLNVQILRRMLQEFRNNGNTKN